MFVILQRTTLLEDISDTGNKKPSKQVRKYPTSHPTNPIQFYFLIKLHLP